MLRTLHFYPFLKKIMKFAIGDTKMKFNYHSPPSVWVNKDKIIRLIVVKNRKVLEMSKDKETTKSWIEKRIHEKAVKRYENEINQAYNQLKDSVLGELSIKKPFMMVSGMAVLGMWMLVN